MKLSPRSRIAAVAAGLGLAIGAYCCYGPVYGTVHYYSAIYGSNEEHFVDFGRSPQDFMVDGWGNEMPRAQSSPGYYSDFAEWPYEDSRYLAARGRGFEIAGNHQRALRAYSTIKEHPNTQNFTQDRREIFAEIGSAKPKGLEQYLKATYLNWLSNYPVKDLAKLDADPVLGPHIAYALAEGSTNYRDVAKAYARVHYGFKPTPRGEAGLIMAARTLANSAVVPATKEDWALATHYARQLIRTYPKSRFVPSAMGILTVEAAANGRLPEASKRFDAWLAAGKTDENRWEAHRTWIRLLAKAGETEKATMAGLRGRAAAKAEDSRTDSGLELKSLFAKLDAEKGKRLRARIAADSVLLENYIAYRIEDTRLDLKAERELCDFAARAGLKLRKADAGLLARIAQINYNVGRYMSARNVARRALGKPGTIEQEARARYVLASSEARLGRPSAAIREYRRIVQSKAPKFLRKGAMEPLARLYERAGNNAEALRLYADLGYDWDMAISADALCSIPELRGAIRSMPHGTKRDVLQFTLAKRYMRKGDYASARREFHRLGGTKVARYGLPRKKILEQRRYDDEPVPDPMKSLAALEGFDRQYRMARGRDAKAQALYDKAAYIYHSETLLFYSPGLWSDSRAFSMDMYWNESLAGKKMQKALTRYCWEHEAYAHSLALCKQIIEKYPRSKVAPKAYYTAAISAQHLGSMNEWWRSQPRDLTHEAGVYLARLSKRFPKDPLAKPAKKYAGVFGVPVTW